MAKIIGYTALVIALVAMYLCNLAASLPVSEDDRYFDKQVSFSSIYKGMDTMKSIRTL